MAKRKKSSPADGGGIGTILLLAFFIGLLIVGVIWLLKQQFAKGPDAPTNPPPPTQQTQSGPSLNVGSMTYGGQPRSTSPKSVFTVLQNTGYVVGFSEDRRAPLWSSYRVFKAPPGPAPERPKGDFLTDFRTKIRVTHHDYTGSGYDRGHMAPNFAIATRYGVQAQRETFFMTNICPQAPDLNQKVWENLERAEAEFANSCEEVWVTAGPIFADMQTPPGEVKKLRSGVSVPVAFYKIIVDEQHGRGGKPRLFAVIMPQTVKGTESPRQFTRSVREIEAQTALDFLSELPPEVQAELESKAFSMWSTN